MVVAQTRSRKLPDQRYKREMFLRQGVFRKSIFIGTNASWVPWKSDKNHLKSKGPPQLKKITTPSPPSSKKGPTDENVGISYLIVIIKFGFSEISNPLPPYFIRKPNLTNFCNWGGPLKQFHKYAILFLFSFKTF